MDLAPAGADELAEIIEVQASPGQVTSEKAWRRGTPDGDIYPHLLDVGPLSGLILRDDGGRPDRATLLGSKCTQRTRVHGADWDAKPLEFARMFSQAFEDEEIGRRLAGKQPRPAKAFGGGSLIRACAEIYLRGCCARMW